MSIFGTVCLVFCLFVNFSVVQILEWLEWKKVTDLVTQSESGALFLSPRSYFRAPVIYLLFFYDLLKLLFYNPEIKIVSRRLRSIIVKNTVQLVKGVTQRYLYHEYFELTSRLPVTSCIVDSAALYIMVVKFRNTIWPHSKGTRSEYSRENPKSSLQYIVLCLWSNRRQFMMHFWSVLFTLRDNNNIVNTKYLITSVRASLNSIVKSFYILS
jgi:hypothetical protein